MLLHNRFGDRLLLLCVRTQRNMPINCVGNFWGLPCMSLHDVDLLSQRRIQNSIIRMYLHNDDDCITCSMQIHMSTFIKHDVTLFNFFCSTKENEKRKTCICCWLIIGQSYGVLKLIIKCINLSEANEANSNTQKKKKK